MKRDLDLARQLLLNIENRGTDCSVSVLRSGPEHETDERIRHHLRLLIDAGLLKEIDRTSSGIPCVRMTHDGHELIELARHESRWSEAKWVCQDRIGGLSLSVIRSILLRWAIGGAPRARHAYAARSLRYAPERYAPEPYREGAAYRIDRFEDYDVVNNDRTRYVRVEPVVDQPNGRWGRDGIDLDGDGIVDLEYDSSLPPHLI